MSVTSFFKCKRTIDRLHRGPLGKYIDSYASHLVVEGHTFQSGARCVRVVADYSAWLVSNCYELTAVNEASVKQYEKFRIKHRHPLCSDHAALVRLLVVLRKIEVIEPAIALSLKPLEKIEHDFEQFLREDRGLCEMSIIRHRTPLRKFLNQCCSSGISSFTNLTGKDVVRFLVQHAHDQSPSSAKNMCWTLRAFARYLVYRGYTKLDLSSAVPSIRTWKLATLPERLSPEQIETVLNCCDRSSAMGLRDYAVLMLVSRLGLRANEVASLMLDDIHWHAGSITIHGKGRTVVSIPLLSEVGAAISDYLQNARPKTDNRFVFIRILAPHSQFASSSAISEIATSALRRAGFNLRRTGTHIFRHSLATNLLQAGASLSAIGQVLRHKDHDTTRIYAKVDLNGLRTLAMPWPGEEQ